MSTPDEIKTAKRQLAIKTGVVKRLVNEWKSYQVETTEQRGIASRLASKEGADEWDIQNANKVLGDCEQMIEPARKRAVEALQQLQDVIALSQSEAQVAESDEFTRAQEVASSHGEGLY